MLPKLPKDILLKIVGIAHLIWVKDKIILEEDVYERTDLAYDMWDSCELLTRKLFKKRLKLLDMRISSLEKNLFGKMTNMKIFNPEDPMYEYLKKSGWIDEYGNYKNIDTFAIFQLEDQHSNIWHFEFNKKRLTNIINKTENNFWYRRYERSWGGDIETPVLRFYSENLEGDTSGLFIYSEFPPGHKYILSLDIAENMRQNVDFTTRHLRNILLKNDR